ncbi:WbqC family protein [Prochlorococcus sp. MIT 1223]|uniref:WbqC family protein n=1 Tax=Prochlorococcus sp. MIT 1223 TaxID=3096217 RepID=UPI002A75B6E6|nr:WbqC family protein [Prochlorococcus sp. MIT 1223]
MNSKDYKKIAIMQPTFIPWIGYFGLIKYVDLFVFLDNVQFDKRSWQQRNKIKTPKGLEWITVPVLTKGKYSQLLKDVRIDSHAKFAEKTIKTITSNYSKSRYFDNYSEEIFELIKINDIRLVDLNINLIKYMNNIWNINTPILRSSQVKIIGKKDELLFNLCNELNCNTYVSPYGAEAYLQDSKYFGNKSDQIELVYFKYTHPSWKQLFGAFLDHSSALDLLFNTGEEGINYINKGLDKY